MKTLKSMLKVIDAATELALIHAQQFAAADEVGMKWRTLLLALEDYNEACASETHDEMLIHLRDESQKAIARIHLLIAEQWAHITEVGSA